MRYPQILALGSFLNLVVSQEQKILSVNDGILNTCSWSSPTQALQSFTDPQQEDLRTILSSSAKIYTRGEEAFDEKTLRWQKIGTPNVDLAVAVANEADVIRTINFANQRNIPFIAASGSHGSIDSLSTVQNGIEIWMRNLNRVRINPDGETATIGGGTKMGEVTQALWAYGKQTGMCETDVLYQYPISIHCCVLDRTCI